MSTPQNPEDNPPPPGGAPPPPQESPYPQQMPPQQQYQQQYYAGGTPPGTVPPTLNEIFYKPGMNVLLYAVTCGIWGIVWSYKTHEDLKNFRGEGLGGIVALVIAFFISPVIMFTVPYELEKAYNSRGWESPVSTIWGLWFLLPIIGQFVWYFKVQEALNNFWTANGSAPAQS